MPRIAIIIASKGRRDDLGLWLGHVRRQSLAPAVMIWSLCAAEDLPDLSEVPPQDRPLVTWSQAGTCAQRNAGLHALPDGIDIVAFFDDDYVPSNRCLEGMARVFAAHPEVIGVTGHLLADGIHSSGVSVDAAMALVEAYDHAHPPARPVAPITLRRRTGLYGCNMALRAAAIADDRFDEQLPLYGWQEDVDFAARISRHGPVRGTNAFAGVHRGAKGGRTSGVRFGYSQVANIVYLCRKRTMSWPFGLQLMWRNILANHGRMLWSEPWTDRKGRARGNWLAFADLLRGRLHPMRILELGTGVPRPATVQHANRPQEIPPLANPPLASPPLVSIVVINYNYAAFLACAIDSALGQSHGNTEVIVVDDGSRDGSAAIIAGYGDRVRAVMKENGGHSSAVNAGFSVARGEYVLFLDADDLLREGCVEQALAAMRPGDAKLQFRLATIDREGRDQAMVFPWFPRDFSPRDVERQALASGWHPWTVSSGNLYARWFLEQLFPLDIARIDRSPDGYLNKLAPLFGPVRTLPAVLGAYRVHGRNAWASTTRSWTVDVAVDWLRFHDVIEAAFVECAAARGVALRHPLIEPFQALEYRMLARRFAPVEPKVAPGRLAIIADGWHWLVALHPDGWVGSIGRWLWLVFLGLAPAWLVQREVRRARAQTGRSALWRGALMLTRGRLTGGRLTGGRLTQGHTQ